jgi:hypothetical protein
MQTFQPKPQQPKPKRRILPWLGLTILIAGLTGFGVHLIELSQFKVATDMWVTQNASLQLEVEEQEELIADLRSSRDRQSTENRKGRQFGLIGEDCRLKECLVKDSYNPD